MVGIAILVFIKQKPSLRIESRVHVTNARQAHFCEGICFKIIAPDVHDPFASPPLIRFVIDPIPGNHLMTGHAVFIPRAEGAHAAAIPPDGPHTIVIFHMIHQQPIVIDEKHVMHVKIEFHDIVIFAGIRIDNPDQIRPTIEEVDHIIEDEAVMVPKLADTRYIRAYCGVRPLITPSNVSDDRNISRGFSLMDHAEEGIENFATISGGKLTTYRLMAEKTADLVCKRLGVSAPCTTRSL